MLLILALQNAVNKLFPYQAVCDLFCSGSFNGSLLLNILFCFFGLPFSTAPCQLVIALVDFPPVCVIDKKESVQVTLLLVAVEFGILLCWVDNGIGGFSLLSMLVDADKEILLFLVGIGIGYQDGTVLLVDLEA